MEILSGSEQRGLLVLSAQLGKWRNEQLRADCAVLRFLRKLQPKLAADRLCGQS